MSRDILIIVLSIVDWLEFSDRINHLPVSSPRPVYHRKPLRPVNGVKHPTNQADHRPPDP